MTKFQSLVFEPIQTDALYQMRNILKSSIKYVPFATRNENG